MSEEQVVTHVFGPDTAEGGSGGGIRTPDPAVNSRLLYH